MSLNRALGQGLDALFASTTGAAQAVQETNESDVKMLKISMVEPRRDQPRKVFDREQLLALSASIKEHGVIQPIIVVEGNNGYYSIIAGERRWRASKLADLKEIPAIVRKYDEMEIAEVSLIENLQREDLNPIEEALGYKTLMDKYGMTQDSVSERVGKSRSNIANMLRLLTLGEPIRQMLQNGDISTGHARALLVLPEKARLDFARKIADGGISVRQTEELVKNYSGEKKKPKKPKNTCVYSSVEKQISSRFGTKVKIKGEKKGKIEIEFYSPEDLTRIVDLLL